MTRRAIIGSFAVLSWVSMPVAAIAAEDVEARLEAMQKRMGELEARLDATTDQLEAANYQLGEQRGILDKAVATGPSDGLTAFLESLEFDGWVSASYWYNFNEPTNNNLIGANTGVIGQAYPFNPDANQFSFDQLWFSVERPVDEENRAGFAAEIAFGKTAGPFVILGQPSGHPV